MSNNGNIQKIYSFDNCLFLATGAHRVLVDVHNALRDDYDATILGTVEYSDVNKSLGVLESEYQKLSNPFVLRNSVLFVHQRRLAMIFSVLNLLLFLRMKVVYVHHNILGGHRFLSFFPRNVVTISDKCIANLTDYFGINLDRITKIYNSVPDTFTETHHPSTDGKVRLLYPATVYPVKRQIQLYQKLNNVLNENVEIIFAGTGDDYEELCRLTEGDSRFKCLGFVNNVKELLKTVDYCLLFSAHEGLPISLIEATMMGVPIICNDVGGNLEIGIDGFNAFVCKDWNDLAGRLNSLHEVSTNDYMRMSENSRQHFISNFTVEQFRTSYKQLVSDIIKKK